MVRVDQQTGAGQLNTRHPSMDRDLDRKPQTAWTKTAEQILDSIARYCTRINYICYVQSVS
jgi:hypothetical protein